MQLRREISLTVPVLVDSCCIRLRPSVELPRSALIRLRGRRVARSGDVSGAVCAQRSLPVWYGWCSLRMAGMSTAQVVDCPGCASYSSPCWRKARSSRARRLREGHYQSGSTAMPSNALGLSMSITILTNRWIAHTSCIAHYAITQSLQQAYLLQGRGPIVEFVWALVSKRVARSFILPIIPAPWTRRQRRTKDSRRVGILSTHSAPSSVPALRTAEYSETQPGNMRLPLVSG
jgi:hypothetical protein